MMSSNGLYVLDGTSTASLSGGRLRFGGAPDILQQALREVSAGPEEPPPPPSLRLEPPRRPFILPKSTPESQFQGGAITFSNRVVYKVIYPEDLDLHPPPQPALQARRYPRKRGRPRRGEEGPPKPPHQRAKNLKEQFGLTQSQISGLAIFEDEPEENGEEEPWEEELLSKKITRSGRISKPPPHLPLSKKISSQSGDASQRSILKVGQEDEAKEGTERPSPPVVAEEKPKRQFNIPPKYRCRVCNKIYLGNRKMLKHIKLFPNHGPCEEPPKASSSNNLHVPIIPMARNQLEDLVKYLDAELVLDVVSKKMFDNFSLWELVVKKMSSSGRKGPPLVEAFLSEIEAFLAQIKKLFDHCFTATKLGDKKTPLHVKGELTQAALNVSEGPWYLEDLDHIPSEFHRILGYKQRRRNKGLYVNPASSDSLEDGNSNLSVGEKDSNSSLSSPHSLGAQMVLETNLGAVRIDEEESLGSPKKRPRLDSLDEEEEEDMKALHEEEEEIEDEDIILEEEDEVDPKKVLEQNGIIISSNSNDEAPCSETPHDNKVIHVSTSELALEIESLGPFPPPVTSATSSAADGNGGPRLPSFSSIIAAEKSSEDLLALATTLESSPPRGKSIPEDILVVSRAAASPPLDASLIDCNGGDDAKLSTSTVVTFNNQQPIFSLSPSSKPSSNINSKNTSSSSSRSASSHFLSDLSNVLLSTESDTNDFGFPGSALSISSLKTPEKLLHSIPPASMMMKKVNKEERTNFLGALSSGGSSSSPSPSSTPSSSAPSGSNPPSFEATPLISSTLADVTQTASMRLSEEPPPSRDSLSSLFDEVHHDAENIFPPPPT